MVSTCYAPVCEPVVARFDLVGRPGARDLDRVANHRKPYVDRVSTTWQTAHNRQINLKI